ncbi:MAG: helix-turn-helix domain-containing protein [Chloroflexi bacterium]|nr:helix-turn-helix domain-containing protein [Chloroflexota bacterium]
MGELGTWLVRAREARGLTLEDAERDTRISRRYLQALEAEHFEVIPAPVYARGFLRSYSQYLGLDPQEMLALFPRDEEAAYPATVGQPRATRQQPLAPVSPSRPQWQRPDRAERQGAPGPQRPRTPQQAPSEPVIGIDIGVPSPARRIQTDPAAQTRALTVLVIAVAGVLGVILLAMLISKLGGGSSPASESGSLAGSATQTAAAATAAAVSQPTQAAADLPDVPKGVVPNVTGQQVAAARLTLQAAGYRVKELTQKDSAAKGLILQQAPAAGITLAEGSEVTIVVSGGP